MTQTKPGLAELIEGRIGADFDGECRLTEDEARQIILALRPHARMREALAPFAEVGAELAASTATDEAVIFSANGKHIRLADLRRAHTALQETGNVAG